MNMPPYQPKSESTTTDLSEKMTSKGKKMDSFCCCCGSTLAPYEGDLVPCVLAIPGEPEVNVAATVCDRCSHYFEAQPAVVGALVTAHITRLRDPDRRFTPNE